MGWVRPSWSAFGTFELSCDLNLTFLGVACTRCGVHSHASHGIDPCQYADLTLIVRSVPSRAIGQFFGPLRKWLILTPSLFLLSLGNGWKLDIAMNSCLTNYIVSNFPRQPNGRYRAGSGSTCFSSFESFFPSAPLAS